MDHEQGGCIVETATGTDKYYHLMKKTLQFVMLVSFFSLLHSCFSSFHYNLHFSTLVFPLFAHALDRKYMFLICNGILAFLAKNLSFSSSSLTYTGLTKNDEDGVPELPSILKEATVEANVAVVEYAISPPDTAVAQEEETKQQQQSPAKEMETEDIMLESEDCDEEDDDEVKGNKAVEEVNDARVSTEELNKKFEEFIRKMKEELRIEAQQQLIQV